MPRARAAPRLCGLLAGALGVGGASGPSRAGLVQSDPVRGEYGFLSTFGGITEEQAREKVRRMVDLFGVLEFQFYDAFSGYSPPANESPPEEWTTPLFSRPVTRAIVQACTDEIRKLRGRSWLYVQAMGTDPGDLEVQKGFTVIGKHRINNEVLLDVMLPTADWAMRIASPWASFASALGFSGLHWDMLGNFKSRMPDSSIVADFLRAADPQLRAHGLAQTCNFVDGYGWDASLVGGTGWSSRVVAFPYWEAWTLPAAEDRFFEEVAPLGSVLSCFPGKGPDHEGERQNRDVVGVWPLDLVIGRWHKARCHGSAYLAVGDGEHHVQSEYLPDSSNISEADVAKLREEVFARPCGRNGSSGASAASALSEGQAAAGPARGVSMDPLRGEYGFLTDFGNVTEAEARARVRGMAGSFGILEFQFFDAFKGYSQPPGEDEEEWVNVAFNRSIKRSVVKAYVDEIRLLGGRSWLYVQAMGTDPHDSKAQEGFDVAGAHMLGDRQLLDVVPPSALWAARIAPQWAAFAASLGFSGVHWDTMPVPPGPNGGRKADTSDLVAFLREALAHLLQRGLAQTCTFTRGFPWDPALASGAGWSNSLVAFPYWVAWSLPADENTFFEQVAPMGGGVYACYPGADALHQGESQNEAEVGVRPRDLLVRRWRKTRCRGSAYVAVGDGARHVQSNYLPDTASISYADLAQIHDSVFSGSPCDTGSDEHAEVEEEKGEDENYSSVDPITILPDHSEHSLRIATDPPSGGPVQGAPAWLQWLAFGLLVGVVTVSVGALLARAWAPGQPKEAGFRAVGEAREVWELHGDHQPNPRPITPVAPALGASAAQPGGRVF